MAITVLNAIPPPPRFSSAGPTTESDWVQLYRWFVQAQKAILQSTLEGTFAELLATPPSSYLPGTPFFVTDLGVTYLQVDGAWVYQSGTAAGLLNTLPTGLTPADKGLMFSVTDYGHSLTWDGAFWGFSPGDSGSGYMQLFEIDPTAAGWHLYDGSVGVPYLKSDGTLGAVDLPNLAGDPSFLVAGSPNGAINPAVAPTATGGGGTVETNTTGITLPTNTGGPSATTDVQSGSGTTVASDTHTHPEGSITDPGHDHDFTAVQPTISADGVPQNIVRRPWFRQ